MIAIMAMIAFASFVVVANNSLSRASEEKRIFQSMWTFHVGIGKLPDLHLDDPSIIQMKFPIHN